MSLPYKNIACISQIFSSILCGCLSNIIIHKLAHLYINQQYIYVFQLRATYVYIFIKGRACLAFTDSQTFQIFCKC